MRFTLAAIALLLASALPAFAHGPNDPPHQAQSLGDFKLESGETIRDFSISYVTHGTLNADKSNAILMVTAIGGNHHRIDYLIGPGKALDPAKYFIIATDAIGNGLTTSPSNSKLQPRMQFPRFNMRDMVNSQQRLVSEKFGIRKLVTVVGASMGGMQALQWAVSHPRFMECIVAMTPMARTSPWSVLVTQTARACLVADRAWNGNGFDGEPERGWRAYATLMYGLVMRTPSAVEASIHGADEVHRWVDEIVSRQRAARFDAQDYLYQSWAYEAHDVGTTPGFSDTRSALRAIAARTLVLAPPLDLFNPVSSAREAAAAINAARYVEIPSVHGHQSATSQSAADAAFLNRTIAQFLDEA
jgi:homoserine O-acetyltransferase/O-succinyltransferase